MDFVAAVRFLSALESKGSRYGLERMREFAARIGLPTGGNPKFIHVAGTNGKGSVTSYIQSILHGQGHRTGGYFSPFVVDIRERIQFGLELISPEDFASTLTELVALAEPLRESEHGYPTEFEFKTAMGLLYWQRKAAEYVALEVGLGGRLDATNIVEPASCAIVSIGMDHMAILGDTLEKIATEKAGILKPGVPAAVGWMAPEALSAIERVAQEKGCELWRVGEEIRVEGDEIAFGGRHFKGVKPGVLGVHQMENAALALAACHLAGGIREPERALRSIAETRAPGRMECWQYRGVDIILDGAHNGQAAENLARSLPEKAYVLVTNMVSGHDPHDFYAPLLPVVEEAHVAPIDFFRATPTESMSKELQKLSVAKVVEHPTLGDAIEEACESGLPVLVTGSFYLVGEAIRWLMGNSADRAHP